LLPSQSHAEVDYSPGRGFKRPHIEFASTIGEAASYEIQRDRRTHVMETDYALTQVSVASIGPSSEFDFRRFGKSQKGAERYDYIESMHYVLSMWLSKRT
jgi:hypothetical protein